VTPSSGVSDASTAGTLVVGAAALGSVLVAPAILVILRFAPEREIQTDFHFFFMMFFVESVLRFGNLYSRFCYFS
jgi:hypothetical protein